MLFGIYTYGQFSMEGELRPRMEFRDGYKTIKPAGAESVLIFSQRSRLGISYASNLYTTHISIQDVRVWGEEPLNSNQINIALHEAWVEFNASTDFKIKIGRQVLKYDNERLIASTNWNQIGAKHDAIKFSYKAKGWEVDFIGAVNQSGNSLFKSPYLIFDQLYKNLGVAWIKKDWHNFSIANLSIVEGLREDANNTTIHHRFTSGIVTIGNIKNTHIEGRLFYQGGRTNNGIAVSAHWINLELNQKLNEFNSITGGVDAYSGNESPDTNYGDDHAFDILYGGKHKLNGLMDYFTGPKSTKGMGLTDLYVKYNTRLGHKMLLGLDYHYFKTQGDFMIDNVAYKSYLGSEIDISCSIKISSEINITNIFGLMMPSKSMAVIREGNTSNTDTGFYFTTMLTFKPVFFKD